MPIVSIIVPVYNAEQYIKNTIESLRNQTLKDIEIVLVDDGSKDKSLEICKDFEQLDCRVIVVHQENSGVSVARNTGLETCTGKYIGFSDADDEMKPDMYEKMVKILEESDSDMVVCGSEIHNFDGSVEYRYNQSNTIVYSKDQAISKFLLGDKFCIGVWSKLYKREVALSSRFEKGKKMHEDKYYIFNTLLNSNKICYFDMPLYIYIKHDQSVTYSNFDRRWFDVVYFSSEILKTVNDNIPEHVNEAKYNDIYSKMFVLRRLFWSNKHKDYAKEALELQTDITRNMDKDVFKLLSKGNKIEFWLLKNNVWLYTVLVRTYHSFYGDRN